MPWFSRPAGPDAKRSGPGCLSATTASLPMIKASLVRVVAMIAYYTWVDLRMRELTNASNAES